MKKYFSKSMMAVITVSLLFSFAGFTPPDEGMYPLSEIRKLDLSTAGLKIDIDELYNPDGISIVDALVKVGGCSGSFVSDEGLILTNHHCAFGAVQAASTTEKNFVEEGFLAMNKEEEIPAQGLTCLITVSYEDVSDIVLKAAEEVKDISERTRAIQRAISEIVAGEEKKDSTIKAEVSEMFTGKTYVLFRYATIKDVRLVYAPPKSIGEFGGDSDNWIWPRHTGDFTFLRAYVAPDGSPAEYSKENVPYNPKRYLKVNPEGVEEEDFVFILGYPGRTFRHQPSHYIHYQEKFMLPYIADLFGRWMDGYEQLWQNDPELELSLSTMVKTLANVKKNYEGKIQGLSRLQLVNSIRDNEKQLQQFISANEELKSKYSTTLSEIDELYQQIYENGRITLMLGQMARWVNLFGIANAIIEFPDEMEKPEYERKPMYRNRTAEMQENILKRNHGNFRADVDKITMRELLFDAIKYPEFERLSFVQRFLNTENPQKAVENFVEEIFTNTALLTTEGVISLFEMSKKELADKNDPFIEFTREIYTYRSEQEVEQRRREGKLNLLLAQYVDAKMEWQQQSFIPDANSTLRLTYGYIRGYSPADAVYYSPITALRGKIEKDIYGGDYKVPERIKELYEKKDFGRFKNKKLNDVPVAILYNMDTSGGNSGSPIMNAYGELIGVNFDRAYEATINDFAWSEDYSRSIGVDVRYILWVTDKFAGAGYLLKEMGVE